MSLPPPDATDATDAIYAAYPAYRPERFPIAMPPEIEALVRRHAPVAFSISGGKDGAAAALATIPYLDALGHAGPRLLIHSHLGDLIEWRDSLPSCERLAERLGLPLVVVRRAAGGLIERWEQRWEANIARYASLSCVKVILPWSTPGMRFCTSELKGAVICQDLVNRFPGQAIISVSGIRAEESAQRAQTPVVAPQPRLYRVKAATTGYDWHPIVAYSREQVHELHAALGFPLHEAYSVYGSSRVSCTFCIMSSLSDMQAAVRCPENGAGYRRLVELEARSTFAFHGAYWLGDLAPDLLDADLRERLQRARAAAQRRVAAERRIPKTLEYTKGWPTRVPTLVEAQVLAEVRLEVADLLGLTVDYTSAEQVRDRFAELLAARDAREPQQQPIAAAS